MTAVTGIGETENSLNTTSNESLFPTTLGNISKTIWKLMFWLYRVFFKGSETGIKLVCLFQDCLRVMQVGSKTTYESNNESQQVTTSQNCIPTSHNESKLYCNKSRVTIALQQVTASQNYIATSHNESKLYCNKSQRVKNAFQQVTTSHKRVTTSQKWVQRVRIITTSQSYKLTNAEWYS